MPGLVPLCSTVHMQFFPNPFYLRCSSLVLWCLTLFVLDQTVPLP